MDKQPAPNRSGLEWIHGKDSSEAVIWRSLAVKIYARVEHQTYPRDRWHAGIYMCDRCVRWRDASTREHAIAVIPGMLTNVVLELMERAAIATKAAEEP